jgi:enoyl-CoA hydratase
MTYENLRVDREEAIATVTFNRPEVLNALNFRTLDELHDAFEALDADASVRVIVLTGAGEKAFAAGADINELARQTPVDAREFARRGQALFSRIEAAAKPVIAAINGYCLGGGCELVLSCTFRFAADTAQIGQPEINLGTIPGYGGSQRLPRLIGPDRAMDLILTGRRVTAQEAWSLGLVTRVCPAAGLMEETLAFARELASKAPVAVRYAMHAISHGLEMPRAQGFELEATLFGLMAATADMKEGTRAFLEKRKPAFRGV